MFQDIFIYSSYFTYFSSIYKYFLFILYVFICIKTNYCHFVCIIYINFYINFYFTFLPFSSCTKCTSCPEGLCTTQKKRGNFILSLPLLFYSLLLHLFYTVSFYKYRTHLCFCFYLHIPI